MVLSTKKSLDRRIRAFKINGELITMPLLYAVLVTEIWEFCYKAGLHFAKTEEAIIIGITAVLAIPHGVYCTWAMTKVFEKFGKIVGSILKNDEDTFMLYRDERLQIVLYLMCGAVSVIILLLACLLDYGNIWLGRIIIFVLAFCLIFFFVVIKYLDNPLNSDWVRERLESEHPDWTKSTDYYWFSKKMVQTTDETAQSK